MSSAKQAKVELKRRGHSYRSAAKHIGRSYQWICDVLNGRKVSQPVLDAVYSLPPREPRARRQAKQTSLAA